MIIYSWCWLSRLGKYGCLPYHVSAKLVMIHLDCCAGLQASPTNDTSSRRSVRSTQISSVAAQSPTQNKQHEVRIYTFFLPSFLTFDTSACHFGQFSPISSIFFLSTISFPPWEVGILPPTIQIRRQSPLLGHIKPFIKLGKQHVDVLLRFLHRISRRPRQIILDNMECCACGSACDEIHLRRHR